MNRFSHDKDIKLSDLQNQTPKVYFDLSNTDYEFIEKIGTGAYGIVCQAKNLKKKQDFAIKKIRNPFLHKVTLIRTLREIRITNSFNHPNIISIVDIFLKEGRIGKDVYVVFDLMESDLHKIITSNENLSNDHIRYFMYQLLCGVNYIHSASVIHRDLKPANILINSNCHLKIADFGMARLLAPNIKYDRKLSENVLNLNLTQYVMTRWYRAPELLMGQFSYDNRVDLWSCGCILAELYLKRPLFRGDNMINQLKEIVKKMGIPSAQFRKKVLPIVNSLIIAEGNLKPVPLNILIETAPKKVIDLLSHLLVYDPDQRWSAIQSLKHIFFLKYKNPLKEEICTSKLDLSFELELNSIDLLKEALLADILSINLKQSKVDFNSNDIEEISIKSDLKDPEIQSIRSDSPISERTLSADSGKELGYQLAYFECEKMDPSIASSDLSKSNRLRTVSQFTKNRSNKKIITAAQRQKEREDRKLRLKHKRNEKYKMTKFESICQESLSELDRSYLRKWEHWTHKSIDKDTEKNLLKSHSTNQKSSANFDENDSNNASKTQSNEVDNMSAGLSALLLLDDIIENDQNPNKNYVNEATSENSLIDNFDLLFDVDIDDCIDLNLSLLESYSCDLAREDL